MQYDHGCRVTAEVWELSPLDLSIQQYETRCKNYHYRKLKVPNETAEQRTARLTGLKAARQYLDLERNRLMSMISVESQLDIYRNEFKHLSRKDRRNEYKAEEHHPTAVLETNLQLAGRARPAPKFTAHHLIEGKGKLAITKSARLLLFRNDIRINDPDNGVWMPRTEEERGHWSMPNATPHSRIHTHNYERWIYGQIQYLRGEAEIRQKLSILRGHLKCGTQPTMVTAKSDESWDGRSAV